VETDLVRDHAQAKSMTPKGRQLQIPCLASAFGDKADIARPAASVVAVKNDPELP